MPTYPTIGAWIKDRRKELEITQDDLTRRAGCAISTIRKIEIGLLRPSREMALSLARGLQISDDQIPAFVRLARTPADLAAPAPEDGPAPRGRAPTPQGALIGRDQDLTLILDCLVQRQTRLLTLVGPPGVGKTRLALEIAARLAAGGADEAVFVALEAVPEAALVPPAIAEILDVTEQPNQPLIESIAAAIKGRRLLLILDNVEHVLGAARAIAELLESCPLLTILATSQEVLHLSYEQQVPVEPLPVPALPANGSPGAAPPALDQNASVALFVDCARRALPTFALTEDNAAAVAAICAQLDGIPLAIELIAARIKLMSPAELLARLDTLSTLVLNQKQERPPRQHTLRSAIGWSYGLLSPEEQQLFRVMGVFAGGCTLEALEEISGNHGTADVTEYLSTLLDKSLIQYHHIEGGEPRFSMLTMLREYALEQLALTDEREAAHQRYAEYYLRLAEEATARFRGPEERIWVRHLAADHDNVRAVLAWAIDRGRPQIALRLSASLWQFWQIHNHISEGRRWLARALAFDAQVEPELQAKAYHAAATLATFQADNDQAMHYYDKSISLRRELHDVAGMAASLLNLAIVLYHRCEYGRAEALLAEALDHYLALQNLRGVASALTNLGIVGQDQGRYDLAEGCYSEALAIQTELGNLRGQANLLGLLGTAAHEQGDDPAAKALFTRSLGLHRSLGLSPPMVTALDGLAYVLLAEGDRAGAREYWRECLTKTVTMEQPRFIVQALEGFATLAGASGDPLAAARLWSAAATLRVSIDAPLSSALQARHQAAQQRARQACGAAWDQAWRQGADLNLEQAVAEAFRV